MNINYGYFVCLNGWFVEVVDKCLYSVGEYALFTPEKRSIVSDLIIIVYKS